MASNPMQRKSRNSFLLGVIVTLLIAGVVIAFLLLQLKQKNDELEAQKAAKRMVYTLSQNVKAGQILTENMFLLKRLFAAKDTKVPTSKSIIALKQKEPNAHESINTPQARPVNALQSGEWKIENAVKIGNTSKGVIPRMVKGSIPV